jgi:hypothetical protein
MDNHHPEGGYRLGKTTNETYINAETRCTFRGWQARAAIAASQQAAPNADLVELIRTLYRGYVNTLEGGRDKILDLGGDCDPVERMEADDPVLRKARAALASLPPTQEAQK